MCQYKSGNSCHEANSDIAGLAHGSVALANLVDVVPGGAGFLRDVLVVVLLWQLVGVDEGDLVLGHVDLAGAWVGPGVINRLLVGCSLVISLVV